MTTPIEGSINMAEEVIQEQQVEKTYTQAELEAYVSRAIGEYSKKAKEKAAKSTDQRVAELEAELARRDNLDATRSAMKASGIPESLEALFTGDNYEAKIETFSKWQTEYNEAAQKASIANTEPIRMSTSDPKAKPARRSLDQIASTINN